MKLAYVAKRGLLESALVVTALATTLLVIPGSTNAQVTERVQTQFGRYIAPTLLGEAAGFAVGAGTGYLVYNRKYQDDSLELVLRTTVVALLSAHLGGIIGSAVVAHDKRPFLLASAIIHGAIIGSVFLISPDFGKSTAGYIAGTYLIVAPIITMATASIVDTTYANKRLRLAVYPHVTDEGRMPRVGIGLRLSGM